MDKPQFRLIALTVAAAMFLSNLDSTLIVTSLPQIARDFNRQAVDLSAAISGYVLASAALLPLSAWLADRYGARNIFVLSIALFTSASMGCALATNYSMFLGARIVQGAAGALMVPVGRTVVLQRYEGRELLNAVALITWPGLLAPVIAPVLGGMITTYSSWRWNFLLNVPLGIAAVVAALKLMPGTHQVERRPLDFPGLIYLALGLAGLLYAMDRFSLGKSADRVALVVLMVGIGSLLLAFQHLRRSPHPVVDLASYRIPTFRHTNGGVATWFRATISATPFLLPLLFQLGFGFNALEAGGFVVVYFLGNVAMKPATSPLLRHYGFRRVLIWNGVISGLATMACGFVDPVHARSLALAVLFVTGLSRSMQFTSLNTLCFADLPASQRSSGSTLHSVMQAVSTALGVAAAALLLQKSTAFHGVSTAGLADFRVAFVLIGTVGVISALCFSALAPDAGSNVSGHQPG